MNNLKSFLGLIGLVGALFFCFWLSRTLDTIENLKHLTALQKTAIEQHEIILAAERKNSEALKEIAKHKEDFEKRLTALVNHTNRQLKMVLENDKEAKKWWDTAIPSSVLQLHQNGSSDTTSGGANVTPTGKTE